MKRIFISTSPDWRKTYTRTGWEKENEKLAKIGVPALAGNSRLYYSVNTGCFEHAEISSGIILINDAVTEFPGLMINREEDFILRHSETKGHVEWINKTFSTEHIRPETHSSNDGNVYHEVFKLLISNPDSFNDIPGKISDFLFPDKNIPDRQKIQLCHLLYGNERGEISINRLKEMFPLIANEISEHRSVISKAMNGNSEALKELRNKLNLTGNFK